jgi:hypothetical protein
MLFLPEKARPLGVNPEDGFLNISATIKGSSEKKTTIGGEWNEKKGKSTTQLFLFSLIIVTACSPR